MSEISPKIIKKIQTLQEIAADLHNGKDFDITRLTMLKGLCEDSDAAAQFALYLARKSHKAIKDPGRAKSKSTKQYEQLASKAVRKKTAFLKEASDESKESLWQLLEELRSVQSEYERQRWGPVRLIESCELLVVEIALECVLRPWASADLGYRIARKYAERYNPRFGTGLIPESASAVDDIAEFWGRHFLGQGWRKRLVG